MYAARDEAAAAAFRHQQSLAGLEELPLGQRAPSTSGHTGDYLDLTYPVAFCCCQAHVALYAGIIRIRDG